MIVQAVFGALVGLAFVGWGVRVLVRGEVPGIKSTGRVWRSVFAAVMFWFLLGAAVLVGPFVWMAGTAGWMGSDASFWVLSTSVPMAVFAVVCFRPLRTTDVRRQ
ncbi:hypothetical protein EV385_0930 [Krasilnikovia cinnamomea]|uniref:Uncharacterized protein n=1 Tax=Krasilnikovia cinnamomea TaxID=349313 RepID=A0A4Q7ZFS2_9ACTN|nr:hypothetical protein [Krasilnikovia cinnamomea]RZU49194.1 hypothetical protein EV385_0930 [Krasilnikovia cinnamomea]